LTVCIITRQCWWYPAVVDSRWLCVWEVVVNQVWAGVVSKQVSPCWQAACCHWVSLQSRCVRFIKPTSTASHGKIMSQTSCGGFFVTVFYYCKLINIIVTLLPVRRYISAVFAVIMCLSVHLSQVEVLQKWLNVGSQIQCCTIDQGLSLWCKRSLWNSNGITPNGGVKCRWDR